MAVLLAGMAIVLYLSMGAVLLDEIDTGLRSRAATIEADFPTASRLATPTRGLVESQEAFAQVIGPAGTVVESSPGFRAPLLAADVVQRITRPTFFDRAVDGVAHGARLLAIPVTADSQRFVMIVGSSLSDRADALRLLGLFFSVGGPVALALASVAGWLVAGVALRPVERMRRQAAAISVSGRDQRLTVPDAHDEISRLAETLNDMLARLDDASRAERRFLDNASHELRTPLTALKAELDLARARPRSANEIGAALESASRETDRLARMADDLLVLSRAHEGRLPVHRERVQVRELLVASLTLFHPRATAAGITVDVDVPRIDAAVDSLRVRQAIDNVLDNALQFARARVDMHASIEDGIVTITIDDDGPGFPIGFVERAFDAFERANGHREGAGLGLAIVKMVADGHGGTVSAENRASGGARVTLTLDA